MIRILLAHLISSTQGCLKSDLLMMLMAKILTELIRDNWDYQQIETNITWK